jgi:hypothetical protein
LLQSVVSRVASFHEGQDRKGNEGKKENTISGSGMRHSQIKKKRERDRCVPRKKWIYRYMSVSNL